ncbi:MAG: DUF4209 domain-containing protein [Bacteroidales bacterium]|nr:DUF4209 domain-containing protein [Bacteroidales bacterium]
MEFIVSQNIKDFYSVLENTATFYGDYHYNSPQNALSGMDHYIIMTEQSILRGDKLDICNNQDTKEEIIRYLKKRLDSTKNTFLIARYNQTLWNLCKHNNYAEKSINGYRELVKTYMVDTSGEHLEYTIGKIWDIILKLSNNIKSSQRPEIAQELLSVIKDSNNGLRLRYWLLYYLHQNDKTCKLMQLDFIHDVCMDLLDKIDDYTWNANILKLGLFFAEKHNKSLLPWYYEKLGDNEERNIKDPDAEPDNILIPHENQGIFEKMLRYYDLAKNKDKYNITSRRYIENKNKLKFMTITKEAEITPELKNYIIDFMNKIKGAKLKDALLLLSVHNNLFFISSETMDNMYKLAEEKEYLHAKILTSVQMDLNNNAYQSTYEDTWKYEFFQNHYINSFKIIVNTILSLMEQKKLTYTKMRRVLIKQTNFGELFSVRRGNTEITYCWFDKISVALKDFIKQFNNIIAKKRVDWRTSLTMMTIQFESILRDYINVYGNGSIKQLGASKEVIREILLEKELEEAKDLVFENGERIFSDDDMLLFEYTFIKKGFNIRNDIAHGFYIPQDFTCEKAVLVFMCLMRLVVFHKSNM